MRRMWPRVRAFWRVFRRADRLEAAMHEEMRFHIDMETERLVRELGLDPQEARRQAHIRFGGLESYKEESRDARGRQWLDAIAIDARLGVRMLVRHRGLTLAGGFAMAVAIAVGATSFEVITEVLNPALPLEDGAQIVSIQQATDVPGDPERRVLSDFVAWRDQLATVQQLGAFRTVQHNLTTGTAPPEPVKVAEITAAGFAIARTPPLLGRYFVAADEREDAPLTVVIGYDTWQSRFGGDGQIVGRTIELGGARRDVIGIMPRGFKFPIDHQFWIPLVTRPGRHARLQGPELFMFARLAPGVTIARARAELGRIDLRAADERGPVEVRRLVVQPYTHEHLDLTDPGVLWALRVVQLLIGALAFVVAINLAVLIYARTVTRIGEIAVRTALGASRRRILAQLFVEALALAITGTAAGLLLARIALDRIAALVAANGSVPFWIHFELSGATVIYAAVLAVCAAVIMGVLPGLKATGTKVHTSLRELHSRTASNLGSIWTTLVVGQVGVAVAVLPMAVYLAWQVVRMETIGPGFAAESIVVATAVFSHEVARDSERLQARQLELVARLQAEPGVSSVTFSSSVPGLAGDRRIEFEARTPVRQSGALEVSVNKVAIDLFDIYEARILAGRAFTPDDLGASQSVVVNRSFVREFLENRSALGLRFRYAGAAAGPERRPWHQIVGIIEDFPGFPPMPGSDGNPAVYHPAAPGDVHPIAITVRLKGNAPDQFIGRFREIGGAVDPAMQLRRVVPLSVFYRQLRSFWHHLAWSIGLVTLAVILLSAAGIYALMSFAVAQRTREIGIRAALGAHRRGLLLSIFGQALRQLALGLVAGSLLAGTVFLTAGFGFTTAATMLAAVAAVMLIVGMLAALGPARRSLRMCATEALRH